jgi:hypothetical protein
MDARIDGLVRIDLDSRCVTVETDGGEVLVVFVDGAVLDIADRARPVLTLRAGGPRYEDGAEIELGGGFWLQETLTTAADPAYANLTIPATCSDLPIFIAARGQ